MKSGVLRSIGLFATLWLTGSANAVTFKVSYPASVNSKPFTGRVLVFLTQKSGGEPRLGPNWFQPEPMYSAVVTNVQPGQSVSINSQNAVGFPGQLSALPDGNYQAQAVFDLNMG